MGPNTDPRGRAQCGVPQTRPTPEGLLSPLHPENNYSVLDGHVQSMADVLMERLAT